MAKFTSLVSLIILTSWGGVAEEVSPRYFGVKPGLLAESKARLAAGDQTLQPALKNLLEAADVLLKSPPPSVVEKNKVPPSGDKHDYMTIAPYYWPDLTKSGGLPYLRDDGNINPDSRTSDYDHGRISLMASSVETLALAYYFTGKEIYAERASLFLWVWFLDPATRMNPHMEFAQGVLGVNTGRGTGIIEGRHLATAADAAGLLAGSAAWPRKDDVALKIWLSTYFDWLVNSKNGKEESAARNNHGSFYDVQTVQLALVLGKTDVAKRMAETAKQKRIAIQIESDGRQPLELERTSSLTYSRFNLEALFALASLSDHVGVDLWHCRLRSGQFALLAALDFLLPYATDASKKWPYEQIKKVERADFAALLRQAALVYSVAKYDKTLSGFPDVSGKRLQLLYPAPMPPPDVGAIDRTRILKAAKVALALRPLTITKSRAKLSEGGPNDFYSNGDYWWPDPKKPNGLPYIQRDGQTNPENFNQHRGQIRDLRDSVAALGAAYQITREDRYAKKAAELLQVFFLDPATRMNPHLNYAQAVPGVSPGRGIGIIDTLHLIEIPPAIEAMQKSRAFPPKVLAGMYKWFGDYTEWMISSKNGKEEATAKNNHAVAFWLQVSVFARFTRDEPRLAECRRQFKDVFVAKQMAEEGGFPLELKRTKPYAYSIFQLDNMTTLCQVLSTPQDNLWQFESPEGRSIRKAVAYLQPFLADKSKWPLKPDVQAWEGWPSRQPALLFAGLAFNEPKYLDLWKTLRPDPVDDEVRRNIAITQPVLWLR